jgi:hypothetical protein
VQQYIHAVGGSGHYLATKPLVGYFVLANFLGLTQVQIYYGFQQNPLKLSALLVNQKAT